MKLAGVLAIASAVCALAALAFVLRDRSLPEYDRWEEPEDGVQPPDPRPASLVA